VVGIGDAIELHQPGHADAEAIGDLGEGFPWLNRDFCRQAWKGQHHGNGQGNKAAAHGLGEQLPAR
jgi:hypothetical protein